jgi:hypothetical protein
MPNLRYEEQHVSRYRTQKSDETTLGLKPLKEFVERAGCLEDMVETGD